MKIAVLARIVNTKSGSRAAIELAQNLARNSQVTFFASRKNLDPKVKKDLEKKGVQVFLAQGLKLWQLLRRGQFEVISAHVPLLPTLIAKLSGIPIVSTYYGTQLDAYYERLLPYQKPNPKDKILNWLGNQLILAVMRLRLALANQVVAISQYTAKEAKKLYHKDVPYIYLGADSLVTQNPKPKTQNLKPILLSVSRFTPYKGFHVLIKTFKKLKKEFPGLKLTLVGSSSQKNYLKYLKEIGGKDVKILLNISDEALAKEYQKTDIYLSWDHYLFFGLPVFEAALFSKPTIALNRCAAPEAVIHGKTGFLVKNQIELAKNLKNILKSPKQRIRMGREAKKVSQRFTWQAYAKEYEKTFKQIT